MADDEGLLGEFMARRVTCEVSPASDRSTIRLNLQDVYKVSDGSPSAVNFNMLHHNKHYLPEIDVFGNFWGALPVAIRVGAPCCHSTGSSTKTNHPLATPNREQLRAWPP